MDTMFVISLNFLVEKVLAQDEGQISIIRKTLYSFE